MSTEQNPLSLFHPTIRDWFTETFAEPTPPQVMGWPPIHRGENTLILAPTGSGKTLAAFLVCINHLLETLLAGEEPEGVHVLYISPLKALNYDIERNLEEPLEGIKRKGDELPDIRVAVRTGDTPQQERQRMIRRPPHILITTPESLHLILTSTQACKILQHVHFVIVDEIHAVSENKRGTFLVLLLERLQRLVGRDFLRIGLSATQKPLEEVAKFLGGHERITKDDAVQFVPRPVTIIDAGMRKRLDLKVLCPVADMRDMPEDSIWPAIYRQLLELINTHRSTLIFANNRRAVERITAEINDLAGYELARAHHGSVSKPVRRQLETELKEGKLPALVATASLELGIDMGAIDLVCQIESPKSVARGLQRVGRAGHLYKAASKGRLLAKMRSDLLETAAITHAMRQGKVASIKIPQNCLDILAQQIVAMVAMEPWKVDDLYDQIRQAYPYRPLPRRTFIEVVEMLSGRYPFEAFRDLRPRISWDRVNNILYPLPGSQRLAIVNGGALPDTGQFTVYLQDGITKLGELDEEFIYETRVGDIFILGTNTWRVTEIGMDRVLVVPAPGKPARMPFWRGEFFSRDFELGQHLGAFSRELSQRLDDPHCEQWLQQEYDLDANAAINLKQYFVDQRQKAGTIPDDRTVLLEGFRDETGDLRLALLSPFGGRLHLAWKLAILAQFRRQWGLEPESLHSDVGILFRLTTENIDSAVSIIRGVRADNVEELVIEGLSNSPFFGLRFRQNAARAMLLPRRQPHRRTPLWLQRMKARDLLEIVRQYESFPIVVETYRECLQDFLAVEELKGLLRRIEFGEVRMVVRESLTPSPFASSLLFDFAATYLYEWDEPKSAAGVTSVINRDVLQELLQPELAAGLLEAGAIAEVEARLQAQQEGYKARTATELVELLRRVGDLTTDEISERIVGDTIPMLKKLGSECRILQVHIPEVAEPWRWIIAEDFPLYRDAFADPNASPRSYESYQVVPLGTDDLQERRSIDEVLPIELLSQKHSRQQAQRIIFERYLRNHTLVTIGDIRKRYPFDDQFAQEVLQELEAEGKLLQVQREEGQQWCFRDTLERIRRVTLVRQRRQVQPCDTTQFVDFLLHWQHRHPDTKTVGPQGVVTVLEQLQGLALPAEIWDNEIFARRVEGYRPTWLDELCQRGQVVWYGSTAGTGEWGNIVFAFREDLPYFRMENKETADKRVRNETVVAVREALQKRGACFLNDLAMETGLPPSACAAALWELIWRGEVTNDSFAVVRAGKPAQAERQDYPWQQGKGRGAGHRFGRPRRYHPLTGSGRWALLPVLKQWDDEGATNRVEVLARQLLQRYGMVCREIYTLEAARVPWQLLYETFVRLEWRGEIRRGYFVKGLSGAQFAVPQAADELHGYSQKKPRSPVSKDVYNEMILINACDPANLYGAASPLPLLHPIDPGWRLLRHPNNYLVLQNGSPILAIEGKGSRLTPLRELSKDERIRALRLLPQLLEDPAGLRRIKSVKVEFWDSQPVRNSEIAPDLKHMGFRDEFKVMVLEKEF